MEERRGVIKKAQKVVVYGPEGIGKSFFASKFPRPVFEDTEGSTDYMDVVRTPTSSSWPMIFEHIKHYKVNPFKLDTFVLDTADWAERLAKVTICADGHVNSLSKFAHGTGYVILMEEFGRLLNSLTDLTDLGINVVIIAHATMRKFEQPDELGSFDRWEMKLEKKVFPLLKEWADMVLFANYKTYVVNVDNQGAAKGKNKVQGGQRVMFTTHHPCWDAKNRHDLLPELPFDFDEIKHCIPVRQLQQTEPVKIDTAPPVSTESQRQEPSKVATTPEEIWGDMAKEVKHDPEPASIRQKNNFPNIPKPLLDLMLENNVTEEEIRKAVASKGYYSLDTPIEKYEPAFIDGWAVAFWPKVLELIKDIRANEETPY